VQKENPHSDIRLIECPRDAMQGIHAFIPTEKKIDYINQLLKVGFGYDRFRQLRLSQKLSPKWPTLPKY